MRKRQQSHQEMDDRRLDRGETREDRDAEGRFTSEGGRDDSSMDRDVRKASPPPRKKK